MIKLLRLLGRSCKVQLRIDEEELDVNIYTYTLSKIVSHPSC